MRVWPTQVKELNKKIITNQLKIAKLLILNRKDFKLF